MFSRALVTVSSSALTRPSGRAAMRALLVVLGGLEGQRQLLGHAYGDVVVHDRPVGGRRVFGNAPMELLQREPEFESRQVRSQASVGAAGEGDVRVPRTVDVHLEGVG